jgi:gas vesicle protein
MKNGSVLLGFAAGLVAGAVMGILFAPAKGTATRRKLYNRGDEYIHELGGKFDALIDSVTEKFETIRDEAIHMADNGKAHASDLADKMHGTTK